MHKNLRTLLIQSQFDHSAGKLSGVISERDYVTKIALLGKTVSVKYYTVSFHIFGIFYIFY